MVVPVPEVVVGIGEVGAGVEAGGVDDVEVAGAVGDVLVGDDDVAAETVGGVGVSGIVAAPPHPAIEIADRARKVRPIVGWGTERISQF
jgi:hypothetical protein